MICACEQDETGKATPWRASLSDAMHYEGRDWVLYSDYMCREQELRCALELLQRVRPIVTDDDLREEVEAVIGALGDG